MSFAKSVKDEIIKKNVYKNESKALVQGLFLSAGSIVVSNGNLSFLVSNESENVINLLKDKLIELFGEMEVDIVKLVKNFKTKERFELSVDELNSDRILKDLAIVSNDSEGFTQISDVCDKSFMRSKNEMLAFLIGTFLGSGSISVPSSDEGKRKYGYHFEIVMNSKEQAYLLAEIFSNFDIFPKIIERNDVFVLYLKNSDTICDALSHFGASKVVLELMSSRVTRDVNNNINRQNNCISANISKTVNASVKQMHAIEIIQNTIGIENLPDTLSEAALARIANPEGSLSDLLLCLESKISKGALAQRFDKIIKLAEELGDKND